MNTIWTLEEAKTQHSVSKRLAELLPLYFNSGIPITDFGCGPGYYVKALREAGFIVHGIEGTPGINKMGYVKDIRTADLSLPQDIPSSNSLSLEVGEHVEPENEGVFLDNLTKSCVSRLILSWAVPGQGGHKHVNERSNEYVIGKLAERRFTFNELETAHIRKQMEGDKCWWFGKCLMIFDT